MKNYLSIDIETTGLDPETCQILELAAVYDDGVSPIEQLPRFSSFVWHPQIVGEPYALSMNKRCLDFIAGTKHMAPGDVSENRDGAVITRFDELKHNFLLFLRGLGHDGKITVFVKNYGSFDHQFMRKLPTWRDVDFPFDFKFGDVGNLWLHPDDEKIPGLATCLERAGLPSEVTHCALDDALQVVQLVRAWRTRGLP